MIRLLIRQFVTKPLRGCTDEATIRKQYGTMSGGVGIALNLLLFTGKLIAGLISGSIAITADALNNLSDAGSSIVTLVGFRMAGRKPDIEHPFGHGRIEYISGMIVSFIILMMGYQLLMDSIGKIRAPELVGLELLPAGILLVSILVKMWMAHFNSYLAREIHSEAMKATAADSRSDAISTTALLIGMAVGSYFQLPLDGWLGLLVSLLILKTGFDAAKDTISPLLGQPPEPEFIEKIEQTVLSYPEIIGIHDLIVHNYGPGRVMVSLHAEVDGDGELFHLHDLIDNIERELGEKMSCMVTIHLDPIDTHNPLLDQLKKTALQAVQSVDERCSIHDVRLVSGPSHNNLIFDILVPHDLKMADEEIKTKVSAQIPDTVDGARILPVIDVDRDFTGRS